MYMYFNISLPDDLVGAVDKVAKNQHKNRSELIREALVWYIKEHENFKKVFCWWQRAAEKIGIRSDEDLDKFVGELTNLIENTKRNKL
jgi:predicted transcriptional regulator